MGTRSLMATICALLILATGPGSLAAGENPAPGTVIDNTNAGEFAQFLSGAMLYAVRYGLSLKIVATRRIEWPSAYQQATEQHASKVTLDRNDFIRNYVAGLPFPNINPNDPKAGVKIAYNWRWGPFVPDQFSATNLASRTYILAPGGFSFASDTSNPDFRNEYTCDDAIALRTSHRADAAGMSDPEVNEIDWKERDDQCGPDQAKFIAWLYSDPDRMPDTYMYSRATRRWRRLALSVSPNQSCTYSCAQMGLEYTPPQTGLYSWSLAATRTMVGCLSGGRAVEKRESDFRFGEISCEPRRVFVVDMIPRRPGSDLLRARVYIDSETYVYLGGELFRDRSPDLSAAIWAKNDGSGGTQLILSDDLYVPDDRPRHISVAGHVASPDIRGRHPGKAVQSESGELTIPLPARSLRWNRPEGWHRAFPRPAKTLSCPSPSTLLWPSRFRTARTFGRLRADAGTSTGR